MNTNYLACDAILFDLDGVLIDSTRCVIRHWQRFADQHGLNLDTIMQAAHGVRTIETIRLVAPHLDAARETAEFTAREVQDTQGVFAIEGARSLVAALPGNAWAVVTSGSAALAQTRLRAGGLPVPAALVTADDVSHGKPAPEPYLTGAGRLGVAPDRCLVVEDAPAGITSGKAAGIRVVGVASTHSRQELLSAGADAVVDRLTDLTIRQGPTGYRLMVRLLQTRLDEPAVPADLALPPGVGKPALRALASAGVTDLDQLARFTEGELLALHGMGPKALATLKDALRAQDKALAEDPRGAHQALSDPEQEVSKVAGYNPDHKAALDALLLDHPGVRPGKMFGYPAYYAGEKLAICLYEEGVGVKLPAPSAAALLEADPNVIPFQPLGRPKMREWVQINLDRSEDYHQYAAVFDESVRYLLEKQG